MSDAAIVVQNVSKRYRLGELWRGAAAPWRRMQRFTQNLFKQTNPDDDARVLHALRNVSFEVHAGEVLGLIGRNGAGKSTMLKVLSRITPPSAGHIELRGRCASLLEVGTGFHPELTGRENIYLNGSILGMSRREITRQFDEIVDFAGIERFLDTPVKRYSSGMYVRLAFAVAAHLEPEILLVDEVLAVGDVTFQKKCMGKMQDIAGSGRTIVFVSHNLGAISAFCKRVLRLRDGQVADCGSPSEVVGNYIAECYSTQRVREFPPPKQNQSVAIRKLELCGDPEGPGGVVERASDLVVHVDYDVLHPVPGVEVCVVLESADGLPICTTRNIDAPECRSAGENPGRYTATVRFPGKLLAPNTYTLRVSLDRYNGWDTLDHREGIAFELADAEGSISSRANNNRRAGFLQIDLPWRIQPRPSTPVSTDPITRAT